MEGKGREVLLKIEERKQKLDHVLLFSSNAFAALHARQLISEPPFLDPTQNVVRH